MFPILRKNKQAPLTHEEMDSNFELCMFPPFLHIQDQKPQGTHGGTFTVGAWRTRDLNTVLTNTITGASLAANQITLPAGKYYVEASAPATYVSGHTASIWDSTNSIFLLIGTNGRTNHATNAGDPSLISGIVNLNTETEIELRHQCNLTRANSGFGLANNLTTEVYSDIRIWRIGDYVAP